MAATAASSDANQSKNGTVTDGWLIAEDFQNDTDGASKPTYNYLGETPSGTAKIQVDPKDSGNFILTFEGGDYNTLLEVAVTLPAGKTIADYKTIAFDLYRYSDDDNHKQMYIGIDNTDILIEKDYTEQALAETWTAKSYALDTNPTSGNQVKLHIGLKTNKGHYAIDNVRLEENDGNQPPVEPGTFHETANGTVTDGELTVNDFLHHKAANVELAMWSRIDDAPKGNAHTAIDPTDSQNLVAHFHDESDYNTVLEIPVTLPAGKKLADYSALKFNLYRNSGDNNYKRMRVQADDHVIYYKEGGDNDGYEEQAPANQWTEKSYDISPATTVGNSFKLRLGIESDKPDYLIDNIRLVEKQSTTAIVAPEADNTLTITAISGGLTVSSAIPVEVRIYSIDGRLMGHADVDGSVDIDLDRGVYVVSTPFHTEKVAVR